MGTAPVFASTPRFGSAQLTNASGTTASAAILTAVTAGTRVNEVRVCSGPTTAPGGTTKCAILVDDGTNQRVIDTFNMINTADTVQYVGQFSNLILPSGHSIKVVSRAALAAGATLDCSAQGADLT